MTQPLVFIDGQYGTTGLQIHERLADRTDLRLLSLSPAERKDPTRRAEALNACDVAILCLPDPAAVEAVTLISNPVVRVIDASSAHRTHPAWTYGFPEMAAGQAARIATARRVTNPGCYPTGAIGLLRPLVQAGLVPVDYPMSIHAVSGYSGGGRQAEERNNQQTGAPALEVYGLALAHKHPPEIQHYCGLAQRPLFVPAYGAFRQGIVMTIPLWQHLLPARVDVARLHTALADTYAAAPHVRVMPLEDSLALKSLDPQALNGSDDLLLGVCANPAAGQILLFAVFDNLGKGAAGAAVQNLDLMLTRA